MLRVEQPTKPRFTVKREKTSLSIKIPPRRRTYSILSLSFQVLFWVFFPVWGWSFVALLSDTGFIDNLWTLVLNNPVPSLILLVAIIIWIVLGRYIIYSWLWEILGYEIVEVTDNSLLIQQVLFGNSRQRKYSLIDVQDLRAVNPSKSTWSWAKIMLREPTEGSIAFDYGSSTIKLGLGATEAEGKQIVAELSEFISKAKKAG